MFVRIAKYLIPWKGDKVSEIIRKIVFLTAAVVLTITLSIIITDAVQRARTQNEDEKRANQFHSNVSSIDVSNQTIYINTSGNDNTTSVEEKPKR